MTRRSGSRRTARTGDAAEPIESIFAASAGAGEATGEEDRSDHGERDRSECREAHGQDSGAVEEDRDADDGDGHAGYQGDDVGPLPSAHRLARRSRAGPVAEAVRGGDRVAGERAAVVSTVEAGVRVAHLERAEADVCVDYHGCGPGGRPRGVLPIDVRAAMVGVEQVDGAGADLGAA